MKGAKMEVKSEKVAGIIKVSFRQGECSHRFR